MRKRVVIIAVNIAIVLAIAGGTAAYAALNKTVTLSVDGKETSVRTFGSEVSDVLEAKDIKLGEHDVVAPDADSSIEDGSRVAVRYGRQLTVTMDGKKKQYWVTADNVDEALDQLGLRVDDAKLSTSRSASIPREGLSLKITRPKTIKFEVGSHKQKKVQTTGRTVGAALRDVGVELDKDDEVKPKASKQITDGMTVDVTRIETVKRTKTRSIDYDTDVREDDDLLEGKTKVIREGKEGSKKVVLRIVKANGKIRSQKVLDSTVLTKAKDQVEKHGTKQEEDDAPSVPSGVWDKLAECESGGDWHINSGNGYYGGLQFDESTWHAYGGSGLPHENSREQQIAVAEKVKDANGGYGAWPGCSSELGLPQ